MGHIEITCGLIGSASLAIRRGSETPFVHGRIKTPKASPLAIEFNPRCFGQVLSKGPRTSPGNENMEYRCAFRLLSAPSIFRPLISFIITSMHPNSYVEVYLYLFIPLPTLCARNRQQVTVVVTSPWPDSKSLRFKTLIWSVIV